NAYCMRSLTTPFFFNHPTTHGSYTLSLHDALPISSRLRPEDQLDRSCQGASRLADAPGSEPRRAASSRRTVPARKARGHRTGASDRKSTRLNSSHDQISYAVFCLKKKKQGKRIECQ